jgi:hypothetical protein
MNLKAENFGVDWLEVYLPFPSEIHWVRPRTEPSKTRFSILITHTEPTLYGLSEEEIADLSIKFDLIFAKRNPYEKPNIIVDIFGSAWVQELPKIKEFSCSMLLSFGKTQAILPGYYERITAVKALLSTKKIKTKVFRGEQLEITKFANPTLEPLKNLSPLPDHTKNALFESFFSLAIENVKEYNYITEKLIDCFATYTIPIYSGSPNLGDYFNLDGVIQLNDINKLDELISGLKVEDYYERLNAVQENYKRAIPYFNPWRRIEEKTIAYTGTKSVMIN